MQVRAGSSLVVSVSAQLAAMLCLMAKDEVAFVHVGDGTL